MEARIAEVRAAHNELLDGVEAKHARALATRSEDLAALSITRARSAPQAVLIYEVTKEMCISKNEV